MLTKLKPKSEFSRNVLTLMSGTTVAQAIPIAITPILTRLYTPEDFGLFALFIAIVGIFSSVASLRYEQAILIPQKDEDAINIFALGFIILSFISIFLLFVILLFHDSIVFLLANESIALWLYFIPLTLFFVGFFNLLTYFNNRQKNYRDMAQATIIKSIVLAVVQLSVGFVKSGVSGLISGQIISQFFANVRLLKNISKDKTLLATISKAKMIELAKEHRDFVKYQSPHALLNTFSSNMPIYFFSIFFSTVVVGFYSLSTRIVFTPLMIIAGASAKVYNQHLSKLYNERGDTYGFTLKLLKSLVKKVIVPFLLLIVFAPEIFALLFGSEWKEAGVYTQVLSPWLFMVFLVGNISYVPSLLNLQKRALFLEVIYTFLRVSAIILGVYFEDVYVALSLFSMVGFLMLSYNIYWILSSLKKGVK